MKQQLEKTTEEEQQPLVMQDFETVTYGIIEETYALQRNARTSYGIAAYADSAQQGTATIVVSVHDITSDKERLQELISICNHLQLSPIHLSDVIEDFIGI